MVTLTEMVTRVRENSSVNASYDEEITKVVNGTCDRLLRDYNFPKSLRLQKFTGLVQGQTEFNLPEGFKKPLSVRLYTLEGQKPYFSDGLKRREGFMLPSSDGVPRYYYIINDKLVVNSGVPGAAYEVWFWYQDKGLTLNQQWLLDDFTDAVFHFSMVRAAPSLKKPDILKTWGPVWADEQQSLAIYLNELEFQDLDMEMREAGQEPTARYRTWGAAPL